MNNIGTFLICCISIGNRGRNVIQCKISTIVNMCKLKHFSMIGSDPVFIGSNSINRFSKQRFIERCPPFVQPHVFSGFTGHFIAPPHVRQFMCPQCFITKCTINKSFANGNVSGMFHGTTGKIHQCISYFIERITPIILCKQIYCCRQVNKRG